MSTSPQSAVYEGDSPSTPPWKQEVNARLVAHRTRRTRNPDNQPALPGLEGAALKSEAASVAGVAARVAERYSRVPSYREMLAAEAARAAEAAAQAAQEADEAEQSVTEDLWSALDTPDAEQVITTEAPAERAPERIQYHIHPGSLPEPRISPPPQARPEPARTRITDIFDPFEDCVIAPAQPLPVRILEFPRELVPPAKHAPPRRGSAS